MKEIVVKFHLHIEAAKCPEPKDLPQVYKIESAIEPAKLCAFVNIGYVWWESNESINMFSITYVYSYFYTIAYHHF